MAKQCQYHMTDHGESTCTHMRTCAEAVGGERGGTEHKPLTASLEQLGITGCHLPPTSPAGGVHDEVQRHIPRGDRETTDVR